MYLYFMILTSTIMRSTHDFRKPPTLLDCVFTKNKKCKQWKKRNDTICKHYSLTAKCTCLSPAWEVVEPLGCRNLLKEVDYQSWALRFIARPKFLFSPCFLTTDKM